MAENLLFIAHRIPYPPNKGDKIRSYNILRHLAKSYDIDLFFLIDDPRDLHVVDALRPLVKNCFFDVIRPRLKKLQSCLYLLSRKPLSVPYFYSHQLQRRIDESIGQKEFSHVFCFSSPTAEYVFRSRYYETKLKNAHLVMDLIDVDSLKWQQYAQSAKWPMQAVYRREARELFDYELKIADQFDDLLLVSEEEKRLFQQQVKKGRISAISNGVDLDKFAPGKGAAVHRDTPVIVFTGLMDYWPNIDGVTWFVDKVFPLIRRAVDNVKFIIVGANPSPAVKSLAKNDGVEVTGFVNDVRDYIAAADLCVVPLRVARGIQNKVLEAMAMGKAVVCTPDALEGIRAEPGVEVVTSRDAHDFANSIITLLADGRRRDLLGENARKCMEKNYSWEQNLNILLSLLMENRHASATS